MYNTFGVSPWRGYKFFVNRNNRNQADPKILKPNSKGRYEELEERIFEIIPKKSDGCINTNKEAIECSRITHGMAVQN